MHDAVGDALAAEMLDGRARGTEEAVGQVVREHAIDLLRHASVEAAQTGLDVCHGDMQLGGRQCTGECGVGVAIDKDAVGTLV